MTHSGNGSSEHGAERQPRPGAPARRPCRVAAALVIIAVLPALAGAGAANGPGAYRWPLEVDLGLSSTFGEYRGERLHGGIDLRTGNRTGHEVYATKAGEIYRLKVQWRGYGRAVYVRHPGGVISVYAHLDRFEDETLGLERLVRRLSKGNRYPGDVFPPTPIPVAAGQVIAYSGESGAGFPHLHFEMRKGESSPTDPCALGFDLHAGAPLPVARTLSIIPRRAESWLDGSHAERTFALTRTGGAFEPAPAAGGPPMLRGTFRLLIDAEIPLGNGNRGGIMGLETRLDGTLLYRVDLRSYTYPEHWMGGPIFDLARSHLGPTRYVYHVTRMEGNRFPGATGPEGEVSTAGLTVGEHRLEMTLFGVCGATTVVRFPFRVPAANATIRPRFAGSPKGMLQTVPVSCTRHEAFVDCLFTLAGLRGATVRFPGGASADLDVVEVKPGLGLGWFALPEASGTATLRYRYEEFADAGSGELAFPISFARKSDPVSIGATSCTLSLGRNSLYRDVYLQAEDRGEVVGKSGRKEPASGGALTLLGRVAAFEPRGLPLKQRGTVSCRIPAGETDTKRLGIYAWDRFSGRWGFIGDAIPAAGRVSARIRSLKTIALLKDTVAPSITKLTPAGGAAVGAGEPVRVKAWVKETGKGIDRLGVTFTLDGAPVEAEYDPDRGWSVGLTARVLPSGAHTLVVKACDRAGNCSSATSRFTVR